MQAILIYLWENNSINNNLKMNQNMYFSSSLNVLINFFNKDNSNTIYNVRMLVS